MRPFLIHVFNIGIPLPQALSIPLSACRTCHHLAHYLCICLLSVLTPTTTWKEAPWRHEFLSLVHCCIPLSLELCLIHIRCSIDTSWINDTFVPFHGGFLCPSLAHICLPKSCSFSTRHQQASLPFGNQCPLPPTEMERGLAIWVLGIPHFFLSHN